MVLHTFAELPRSDPNLVSVLRASKDQRKGRATSDWYIADEISEGTHAMWLVLAAKSSHTCLPYPGGLCRGVN